MKFCEETAKRKKGRRSRLRQLRLPAHHSEGDIIYCVALLLAPYCINTVRPLCVSEACTGAHPHPDGRPEAVTMSHSLSVLYCLVMVLFRIRTAFATSKYNFTERPVS